MGGINFWSGGAEYYGVIALTDGWWICYAKDDAEMHLVLRKED